MEGFKGPIRDWAMYLVSLNSERMKNFDKPLILSESWSIEPMLV